MLSLNLIIGPLGADRPVETVERIERTEATQHEPQTHHIATGGNPTSNHAETDRRLTEWHTFEVTAYTANFESTGKRPGDPAYGITASGEPVKANHTIACPKSLAFGTRLDIEGVGIRTCADRGGKITEGRLDVYVPDLAEALAFGRQRLNVKIEEESE